MGNVCVKTGAVATGSGGRVGTGGSTGSGGGTGSGGMIGTGGAGTGGANIVMQAYESCLILNLGMPNQSDNCATGLKCLDDCGSSQHCYPVCTTDAECPQSACTRTVSGATGKFCERPFMACNPQPAVGGGCPGTLACYLLGSQAAPMGGDRTVCECAGSQATRESCSETRKCSAGHVCPPVGSPGAEYCQRVCDPMAAASQCPTGTTCRPYGTKWGYCL